MTNHWKEHPPLRVMVAAYLGFSKKSSSDIQAASEFVPVNTVKAEEFNSVLKDLGLPE
ncbi:hypothetical protein GALL_71450 [mine drainage metagenome]|uniref:Uncharacterized protein n=1 Tax=mine drainage metagenome TaxID=410659 RepID=A0A1J5TG29_9ZZZZ